MEVLDDDDFSDLYADVEVQASSAIRALNGLREIPPGDGIIFENATREEKGNGDGFSGMYTPAANVEENGGLKVALDSGDTWDDGSESEADDGNKQSSGHRDDNNRYDSHKEIHVVVDGNEKCVSAGDYSRRKNSKHDSSICEKRKIDEKANQVHNPRKNADADVGNGRDPCFSRASEDNHTNDSGGEVASTRVSRHTHARDPVPSGLDKNGSVQISDLVEDNRHEVSECDSDEMLEEEEETSDDTNRRNSRCRSNKVPSVSEPESSRSVQSQQPTSSSDPSVSASQSDDDIERGHNLSERHSSISREYDRSKYSRRYAMKPSIRDGRYDQRHTGLTRKPLNQQNESNNMSGLRTHLINEDASHAVDVMRPHNRQFGHGKRRAVLNFNSNEKGMPYCNQTESFFNGFHGHFPGNHLGLTYSKNQIWNTHPSYGYKAGGHDGHNMTGRQDFIGKRSTKTDCEGMEDNWYSQQRRHVSQGNTEESRKLIPKYDSYEVTRGTQFSNKGDAQHIRRTKRDYLSPMRDYSNNIRGKYRRYTPSSDRHRDYVDHMSYQNIANEGRETESSRRLKRRSYSPRRVKRKSYSPHNSSDNLWYGEAEDNGRGCIKRQPLPFYVHEEPCGPGRGQIQGASRPKSGYPERNARNSCKEMHIKCGQYGSRTPNFDNREGLVHHLSENHDVRRRHYQRSTNTYITNESIQYHHDLDHLIRRRHDQKPDVLHSRQEVYKSRQQDDTNFHSEGPSYHFRRNNRPDDRHEFSRVEELIDEREVDRHRFKVIREEDGRNQFDGCPKFIESDNFVQLNPTYQNSVDSHLVVGKKCTLQSSKRTSEAADAFNCSKHEVTEWNNYQKPKNFEDLGDFNPEKAASTDEGKVDTNLSGKYLQDKFSKNQQDEYLDIEEGQIISEEIHDHAIKSVITSKDMTQINDVELPEAASDGIGVVEELDDQKIQEIMAKMERRRERFKEPIHFGRDLEKNSSQSLNLAVETDKTKLERPARKRRWLGT